LDPNACATFPVTIRATEAGAFAVLALEHQTDGTVTQHPADGDVFLQPDGTELAVSHGGPPNPAFEQVIYAETKDTGASPLAIVGAVTGLAALVLIGYVLFVRSPARRRHT
jgi:hypothetical protein